MRALACVFLVTLVASTVSGCSAEPSSKPVRILDYGLYDGTAEVRLPDQPGQNAEVLSIKVKDRPVATTTIPCKPETLFGFRLDPKSLPESYHLRLEYEHPDFDPPNGKTLEVDEYDVKTRDEFDGEIIYCFVDAAPHEIVPGKWSFRVLMDGKVVAEKTFQVVK